MKLEFTKVKKIATATLAFALISGTALAQKSVYDVVPGSGPKKKNESISVFDATKKKNDRKVYATTGKRKHLPPGQAKKVYGGSATDYAPGQVKKKKHGKWHKKNHKHNK